MAMKKIPTVEQNLLCASLYINNFKRAIEELVYNSLDAGASSIAIRIFIQENFIQVLDNGSGITKDNFSLLGHKYATSKYVDTSTSKSIPDKYGYKGLCLANIIGVSETVEISSRCENTDDTWMKTFYNGRENFFSKTILRPSKGTTVEIKGFLYNLNIQRKSIDQHNELINIKSALKQLSLVHWNVSISLRDDSKNDIIFRIHKNRTIYDTLRSVFQINENDFEELQVEKNEYKVKAYIGKQFLESNNSYQYIYVNGKFIHKSILHKKLNESLSKSLNIRHSKVKKKHIYENNTNHFSQNVPFYFLFITCPNYDFQMIYDTEKPIVEFKKWEKVNKLLDKLVQFYSGNLVIKRKEINNKSLEENTLMKKKQIKEIMEKILNNKNKYTKISHVQNGVKGKTLKRNRKKKRSVLAQKITETNNPCLSREISKSNYVQETRDQLKQPKLTEKKKAKISALKKTKQHLKTSKNVNYSDALNDPCQSKEIRESSNVKQPNVQLKREPIKLKKTNSSKLIMAANLPKKVLNSQDTKKKKNKNLKDFKDLNFLDFIKRFESPTASVKNRINLLNRQVQTFLENNVWGKNTLNSFMNNDQHEGTTNSIDRSSPYNTTNKVLKDKNHTKINTLNYEIVKNSYDLLKPVTTSQYNIRKKTTLTTYCKQSCDKKNYYTYNETFIPMETYDSHSHNLKKSVHETGCFISETTRSSNFFLNEEELISNIHINSSMLNKFNKRDQDFTIEMSEIRERSECISFGNKQYSSQPDDNYIKSIHFNNTYTLENCVTLSHKNDTYVVNKTFSLLNLDATQPHDFEEISPTNKNIIVDGVITNCERKKHNFVVQESHSDNSKMSNNLDPLNCVEAVLHSSNYDLEDLEKEFNNSFAQKQNSNIDGTLDLNNDTSNIQRSDYCLERNQDLTIIQSHTHNKSIKNCENIHARAVHTNIQSIGIHGDLSQKQLAICNNENKCNKTDDFELKGRRNFIPKGMSPIVYNQYGHQKASVFTDDEVYYKDMIYKNFANDVILNTEIFEPEIRNIKKHFLKCEEKLNSEIQEQYADLTFDSWSLTQAKILGQIDSKFIVSILNGRSAKTGKSSEFLVLFDQHAVDERIRLEKNLLDYIQGSAWNSVPIDPLSIVLSKDDYVNLVNHSDKFTRFGLQWTFSPDYKILLNAIPKAILGKNPRQVEIVMRTVKKLILEQIKAMKSLRGNVSLYPKSIMDLVFSEACRYALKFGDKLSKTECVNLINSLSCCKTPFQCAHGRPVIAVLMEIENNSRGYKVLDYRTKNKYVQFNIYQTQILNCRLTYQKSRILKQEMANN
ncbi:DNA mismatch repair protein Mlh3-like [Bicyclus anynana]|uniref:DNA mismatch repair protein Mlh3-like n=1 Tax=Bicyclus anynana TaxID=110368 RepID=A0ABM3LKY2_BICAN|nr:DNA mismatch repair protein Mlh3-like [Bicyclus anynana]